MTLQSSMCVVSTHHTLLSWTFGSLWRMVMRDSLFPVDDFHVPDMSVGRVKRTGGMVGFGGLRVVMMAAAAGWAAGGSEVKSVNRGPCA